MQQEGLLALQYECYEMDDKVLEFSWKSWEAYLGEEA
jgi:hypothetical protein